MCTSKDVVYIFHHIPKCGGTSLNKVLRSSFITVRDYRSGWAETDYPNKTDISSLNSDHCLCGHFEIEGYYLHQRYPEIFLSTRYRVFTFVREPLQIQLSLFRYEKLNNQVREKNIEKYLLKRSNYLANRFPVTFSNYKEIINRYFFVGILEHSEVSLAILSSMMKKKLGPFPWLNKSRQNIEDSELQGLSQELIGKFRRNNTLDYLVYDYCVEKFQYFAKKSL